MNPLALVLLGLGLIVMVWMFLGSRPQIKPAELRAELDSGAAVLIDVREPAEWSSGVGRGAALLPLSDLRGSRAQWKPFLDKNRDKELLVYCQSGARSAFVAGALRREGFRARNVGSVGRLAQAGWPVGAPRGR